MHDIHLLQRGMHVCAHTCVRHTPSAERGTCVHTHMYTTHFLQRGMHVCAHTFEQHTPSAEVIHVCMHTPVRNTPLCSAGCTHTPPAPLQKDTQPADQATHRCYNQKCTHTPACPPALAARGPPTRARVARPRALLVWDEALAGPSAPARRARACRALSGSAPAMPAVLGSVPRREAPAPGVVPD